MNLIGEHTDYNDGFVLPMAIEQRTYVAATARDDSRLAAHSLMLGKDFDDGLAALEKSAQASAAAAPPAEAAAPPADAAAPTPTTN